MRSVLRALQPGGAEALSDGHTNWYAVKEFLALPEQDLEYRIAARLLTQEPPLDRQVVEEVMGRPRRYSELQPLLKGRNDNVLNKALARLRDEGVIQQGLDYVKDQKTYSLTALGKLVIFRMHEMVPHRESILAYERGVAALRA